MNRLRRLTPVLLGIPLVLWSCGGGGGTGPEEPEPEVRGAISGTVQNGGVGLGGVSLQLGGAASRAATTGASGAFTFNDLEPGAYSVAITVPSGFQLAAGQTASRSVTVTSGQTASVTFQLTSAVPTEGTIAGAVRNGTVGVGGATVTLTGGTVNRTTTTSSAGAYGFSSVPAGGYLLALTVPAGYTLAAGQQASRTVTVVAGATATVDFGLEAQGAATIVTLGASSFSPQELTIAPGTRVRWVNNTGIFHTVTPDGHTAWVSADLNDGQSFEHVFTSAGVYNYYCEPHRTAGMTGVIRVQ